MKTIGIFEYECSPRGRRAVRNKSIADLYRNGLTVQAIGLQFGVTHQRVVQILRALNVARTDGGKSLTAAAKASEKKAGRKSIEEQLWGLSPDEVSQLRAIGALQKYLAQRKNAKQRGIEFALTFPQWWEIWQRSGKWEQRGCGKGRYVMSRRGDVGPYEAWNVFIQPSVENNRQGMMLLIESGRSRHGKHSPTKTAQAAS